MFKKLTFILALAIPSILSAQLKIIETTSSTTDVDGQTFTVSGNPASFEFTKYFHVINEGATTLNLKVRRTEIDVQAGTQNATCWNVCPPAVYAGTEVVQYSYADVIAPSDTNHSFSAHHYLEGLDGCSLYKYEWVDAATQSIVYKTLFIKFDHSSVACAADLSVATNEQIDFNVYPNPTFGETTINIDGYTGELTYEVSNLLGQRSLVGNTYIQDGGKVKFNASSLKEGVYFVTIKVNGNLIRTEKLLVKH
jgi:hypothetical protein